MNIELRELFEDSIDRCIKVKLGLDVYRYQEDKHLVNWREFEAELDVTYPIKGTGVVFGPDIFLKWKSVFNNNEIVNSSKRLASYDITDELGWLPLPVKEMILVYTFTMLEEFGNSVMKIVNPSLYSKFMEKGISWHSGVNKFAKQKGTDIVQKFAESFKLNSGDIDGKFVDLFYDLKQKRNRIAHELKYQDSKNFETDIESIFILICYIYHINDPLKENVNYYPWYDWDSEFE